MTIIFIWGFLSAQQSLYMRHIGFAKSITLKHVGIKQCNEGESVICGIVKFLKRIATFVLLLAAAGTSGHRMAMAIKYLFTGKE